MTTSPSRFEKAVATGRGGISSRVARAKAWIDTHAATGPFDRPQVPFRVKGDAPVGPGEQKK